MVGATLYRTSVSLKAISRDCASLAEEMINCLDDSPELTAGLRHLLEAKDAFVRAGILTDDNAAKARNEAATAHHGPHSHNT